MSCWDVKADRMAMATDTIKERIEGARCTDEEKSTRAIQIQGETEESYSIPRSRITEFRYEQIETTALIR